MKLSRPIAAHTKTLTAVIYQREFLEMSPTFRRIRGGSRNPMDKCFWCKHPFVDGEMMAIASFEEARGSKVLCQKCAKELEASEPNIATAPNDPADIAANRAAEGT